MTTQSPSEGVRRLSIFAGGLGAFLFLGWLVVLTEAFTKVGADRWWAAAALTLAGLLVSFFVPWAFVRVAAWVVAGFVGGTDKPS